MGHVTMCCVRSRLDCTQICLGLLQTEGLTNGFQRKLTDAMRDTSDSRLQAGKENLIKKFLPHTDIPFFLNAIRLQDRIKGTRGSHAARDTRVCTSGIVI
jgi:hypothetical protein